MRYCLTILAVLIAASASATDYGFGGDTVNATTYLQINDSSIYADTITTPSTGGTLDSAVFWLNWYTGGPDSANIVIYAEDSSFVDSTAKVAVIDANRTRYKANFIVGATVSASTEYFVAIHFSSQGTGGSGGYYYYAAGTTISTRYKNSGVGQVPSTLTGTSNSTNDRDKAYWIFYTGAAGGDVVYMGHSDTVDAPIIYPPGDTTTRLQPFYSALDIDIDSMQFGWDAYESGCLAYGVVYNLDDSGYPKTRLGRTGVVNSAGLDFGTFDPKLQLSAGSTYAVGIECYAEAFSQPEVIGCNSSKAAGSWSEIGGTGCTIFEDDNDATYIESTVDYDTVEYHIDNTTHAWETIDSIVIYWRQANKSATKVAPLSVMHYVTGSSDSAFTTLADLGDATPHDSTQVYTQTPSSAAWTDSDLDGLTVGFLTGDVAGGGGADVFEFEVRVYGTIDESLLKSKDSLRYSSFWEFTGYLESTWDTANDVPTEAYTVPYWKMVGTTDNPWDTTQYSASYDLTYSTGIIDSPFISPVNIDGANYVKVGCRFASPFTYHARHLLGNEPGTTSALITYFNDTVDAMVSCTLAFKIFPIQSSGAAGDTFEVHLLAKTYVESQTTWQDSASGGAWASIGGDFYSDAMWTFHTSDTDGSGWIHLVSDTSAYDNALKTFDSLITGAYSHFQFIAKRNSEPNGSSQYISIYSEETANDPRFGYVVDVITEGSAPSEGTYRHDGQRHTGERH